MRERERARARERERQRESACARESKRTCPPLKATARVCDLESVHTRGCQQEKERDVERVIKRDRESEQDVESGIQRDTESKREQEKSREGERAIGRERGGEEREREIERDAQRGREKERESERKRKRERERERERDVYMCVCVCVCVCVVGFQKPSRLIKPFPSASKRANKSRISSASMPVRTPLARTTISSQSVYTYTHAYDVSSMYVQHDSCLRASELVWGGYD